MSNGDIKSKTKSICPVCQEVVPALLIEKDGKIIMEKECKKHGKIDEVCYDASDFDTVMKYQKYTNGDDRGCEFSCKGYGKGIKHMTDTCLAVIDLTNRCNLRCSYCFANSAVSKKIYEPSLQKVKEIIKFLRAQQPRCNAILFSGGEPTLRDDFFEILDYASSLEFMCLMVATNGIKLAADLEYLKKAAEHKLGVLYLSFDGLDDETNREKKNHRIMDKLLNNCRKAKVSVVFVPTVVRGENNHQVYDIIKYAIKNIDVVRGINFQPVGFSGRMDASERKKIRYNIPDLCKDIETQSGSVIKVSDFYPVTAAVPLTNFMEVVSGEKIIKFTMHPMCGSATYIYVTDDGEIIPITDFLKVEKFVELCDKYAKEFESKRGIQETVVKLKFLNELRSVLGNRKIELVKLLTNLIMKRDYDALADFHFHSIFIGAMHFQDPYNMDFERLKRCGVHYVTPNKKLIPFCAYNNLGYREDIEGKFSKPLRSYKKPCAAF